MEFAEEKINPRFSRHQQQSLAQPTFSDGSGNSTTTPSPGTHRAFEFSSSQKTEESATPDSGRSFEGVLPPNLRTPVPRVAKFVDILTPDVGVVADSPRMAWLAGSEEKVTGNVERHQSAESSSDVGPSQSDTTKDTQTRSFQGDLALSTTDDMELDDSLDT